MSYRELRNFTEMMQTLGYPRIISMENFRQPNFPLVAELLYWLIHRYDPNADITNDIDTEQDRVIFIKSAAQFMSTKAHVKLNTKRLYGADGYAVKELLKISSLLYSALRSNETQENKTSNTASSSSNNMISSQLNAKTTDLKACRQLASEITTRGAKLYELLAQEVELREARLMAISRPVDVDEIERGIEECMIAVNEETQKMRHRMDNAASDEKTLEIKIEKKRQELERNQKRLSTLANVRPAFMDEHDRLELELKDCYAIYMEKFRNLTYLEQQLEDRRRTDLETKDERESSLLEIKMQVQEDNRRTIDNVVTQNGNREEDGDFILDDSKPRYIGNMTGEGIASDDGSASLSTGSRDDVDPLQEEEEEEEEEGRDFIEGETDDDDF